MVDFNKLLEDLDNEHEQNQEPIERLDTSVPYCFMLDTRGKKYGEIIRALSTVEARKSVILRYNGQWLDLGNEFECFVLKFDHYFGKFDNNGELIACLFQTPTSNIKDWVDCFLSLLVIDVPNVGLLPVKFTAKRGQAQAFWDIHKNG